ncbi:transketolase [Candidatus Roizmanbacteria bacterium RIFCSPLOWO2_01_FULL_42_14]|uniref:Transketolase n=3 Tax=Candidatus Roizmaniibacteriota TaxID=1752723 RepID=A0A1F7JW81_9BACT|nr:MAG: transketolase [Candidatus Roizmanbacteria bacterium RIFCSPHIGHO2_02_FULL_43_11]OGK51777.1 MAG: transketolase [Candidatus Roizmanbacteria bacterium RIFCSPLOWO2_01_FULL_42_14]OGK59873.1 MAG: transketolase [Candidatus Roizmanbacteria bacterium RIFCSPLOWO2_02_FULL_43_10]
MTDYEKIARLIRYWIIQSTTKAGSGHLSSSLSAVDLMTVLFFGDFFHYDIDNPAYHNNDRLIFSKGHASPLLYAMWAAAGGIEAEELLTLRTFGSRLEGHPTRAFSFAEIATGSLGQGLSVGLGMALNAKYLDKLSYRTWVLLGDSEMSEGQNWEALQIGAHYCLDNLVGIIDINRLGQRGETMLGYDIEMYARRCEAFGWHALCIDGHDYAQIESAYQNLPKGKPIMIIAKTVKGKGVSFVEDKDGWHGRVLSEEEARKALDELGDVDISWRGDLPKPTQEDPAQYHPKPHPQAENFTQPIAPRKAYGHALVNLHPMYPQMVVLDAEVSNSTFAKVFKEAYPERFFEMYIAEQNMVGVAVGLAARGKIPFVSTFASFFTRAVDQIRVAQYSQVNLNLIGSHVGVSIGEDGPTQMGLEDIAIMRAILRSVVLYPADHVACEKLITCMADSAGISYLRATRTDTQPIYPPQEEFHIGGSKTLKNSKKDEVTLIAAGITLYEALKAYDELIQEDIHVRVIDLYSIKPLDISTLQQAAQETKSLITIEDHFADGGLGDAVRAALYDRPIRVYSLAVCKMPKSGTQRELLDYEEISAPYIVSKVKDILSKQ